MSNITSESQEYKGWLTLGVLRNGEHGVLVILQGIDACCAR